MRVGRFATVVAAIGSITFGSALLLTAAGCSNESGPSATAAPDPEGQKLLKERRKENQAKKGNIAKEKRQ
jgi:hypothetical protein